MNLANAEPQKRIARLTVTPLSVRKESRNRLMYYSAFIERWEVSKTQLTKLKCVVKCFQKMFLEKRETRLHCMAPLKDCDIKLVKTLCHVIEDNK